MQVVAEMTVRADLCTRPAVLHGGAIMAFADTLGATGTILNLPEGTGTTTIESKTNFIAGAPLGARKPRIPTLVTCPIKFLTLPIEKVLIEGQVGNPAEGQGIWLTFP